MESMDLFAYDQEQGVSLLCGVDEAGRGPLAGDVYAAAVILPEDCGIEGLNDSKKLSEKKREALYDEIIQKAVCWNVATASVVEIDTLNILQATFLAMRRAVEGLSVSPELILVDGNRNPFAGENVHCRLVVKGDATSAAIAAASILAKVSRDRYMKTLAEQYPQYQFEKHKGYGTKLHYELLTQYGISPVHRKSFLKKFTANGSPHVKTGGELGEDYATQYLMGMGYDIVDHNVRSPYGEIDLIARKGDILAFVEVKTRSAKRMYEPREAVSASKQKKIVETALLYLSEHPEEVQPRFDVVEVFLQGSSNKALAAINHIEDAFTV